MERTDVIEVDSCILFCGGAFPIVEKLSPGQPPAVDRINLFALLGEIVRYANAHAVGEAKKNIFQGRIEAVLPLPQNLRERWDILHPKTREIGCALLKTMKGRFADLCLYYVQGQILSLGMMLQSK